MAVAVGQRCVVRIKITDVELRKARDIKATIKSPQGEEECLDVSFDEVSGLVYVSVDVNSVGSWSMWLGVRFAEELFYTPAFVFAEVEGDAKSCDAPYIVDVEVEGESVTVTPPKIDVDAVTQEEFDALVSKVESKVDKVEGKGLSTNDFTDEYKQKVDEFIIDTELSPTSDNAIANSAVVNGLAGLAEGVSEAIGNVSEQLGAEIETKANKDDYYPEMSVGMADNLVGRGDVQYAHINFRPSAGADNITDGAARIERIKGNSVVWNQAVSNADFRNGTEGWTSTYADIYARDGYMEFVTNEISSSQFNQSFAKPLTKGHKYIIMCDMKRDTTDIYPFYVYFGKMAGGYDTFYGGNYSSDKRHIATATITATGEIIYMLIYPTISAPAGVTTKVYSVRVVDLTKMFGAGNEPTSYEEYLQRKPMNIEDEYAYNAGTLVDMKVDSLVSVGDNAFDGIFERGQITNGTPTYVGLAVSNIFTKNIIKVVPNQEYYALLPKYNGNCVAIYWNWYDDKESFIIESKCSQKVVVPTNACYLRVMLYVDNGIAPDYEGFQISLLHSGWKAEQMKYYPYQQEVKDLSFINEAFPEGMRSAGSAFDEIRFNPTKKVWEKIVRVGVRAYAEGDAEDSSVSTDGKTTNYPLDNPTPTTIDLSPNFNLDYLVWDFGTEEAIVPNNVPSAPFRADINYEPNAVDDLRWAVSEIRSLKAQIAQMQTSVTNLTE